MSVIECSELSDQSGELLPARDTLAMFSITIAPVTAVNVAIAVNAATVNSTAQALAGQWITTTLHT